eukprot:535721_1
MIVGLSLLIVVLEKLVKVSTSASRFGIGGITAKALQRKFASIKTKEHLLLLARVARLIFVAVVVFMPLASVWYSFLDSAFGDGVFGFIVKDIPGDDEQSLPLAQKDPVCSIDDSTTVSAVTCEVSKSSKPEEIKLPHPPKRRLHKSATVSDIITPVAKATEKKLGNMQFVSAISCFLEERSSSQHHPRAITLDETEEKVQVILKAIPQDTVESSNQARLSKTSDASDGNISIVEDNTLPEEIVSSDAQPAANVLNEFEEELQFVLKAIANGTSKSPNKDRISKTSDASDDNIAIVEGDFETHRNSIFPSRKRKYRGVLNKDSLEFYKKGSDKLIFSTPIHSLSHERIEPKMEKNSRPQFRIDTRNDGKMSFRVNGGPACEKLVNVINKKVAEKKAMDRPKSQLCISEVICEALKGLKPEEMKLPHPSKRRLHKSATVSGDLQTRRNSIFPSRKRKYRGVLNGDSFELYKKGSDKLIFSTPIYSHDRIELKREKNSRAKFQITIRNYGKVSFRVNDGPTCEKLVNLINKKETQKESMDGQKSQLRSSEVTCEVSKDSKPEEMKLPQPPKRRLNKSTTVSVTSEPQPPKRRLNKSTTVSVTSEAPKGLKPVEMKLPQPPK